MVYVKGGVTNYHTGPSSMIFNIIIMDPPGVFIVFVTLLFFTITIHTATDKSADDVGNYYVELAET